MVMAKGEVAPRADDTFLDAAAVTQVFDQVDLEQLKATTASYVALAALVERVCRLWTEKARSAGMLNLDRVLQIIAGIVSVLERWSCGATPPAIETAPVAGEALGESVNGASDPANASSRVASVAAAAAALSGVAAYSAAWSLPVRRCFWSVKPNICSGNPSRRRSISWYRSRRNGRHQHRPRLVFRPVGRSYGGVARRRGIQELHFAGRARAGLFGDQSRSGARFA